MQPTNCPLHPSLRLTFKNSVLQIKIRKIQLCELSVEEEPTHVSIDKARLRKAVFERSLRNCFGDSRTLGLKQFRASAFLCQMLQLP